MNLPEPYSEANELARLKRRVQEQNELIEQLLQDNADLKSALNLLEDYLSK